MSTDNSNDEGSKAAPSPTPAPPAAAEAPPSHSSSTWKLPDGIEDHIESGLIKSAIGATAGGLVGMILFRAGGGWRSASVATGVGVAVGSTYERIMADYYNDNKSASAN